MTIETPAAATETKSILKKGRGFLIALSIAVGLAAVAAWIHAQPASPEQARSDSRSARKFAASLPRTRVARPSAPICAGHHVERRTVARLDGSGGGRTVRVSTPVGPGEYQAKLPRP